MDLRSAAVNLVWSASSLRAWRRYRASLARPAETQRQLVLRYMSDNRDTAFGRAHRFASIRCIEEYQERVPLVCYDDIEPLIQRIANGERGVLTSTRVERFVPSGGSTAAAKLIPFTRTLRREFSHAIDAWIVDLFAAMPALAGGPAYWSITPSAAFDARAQRTVIPVGFEEDSAYLGGVRQALAHAVMAVPAAVGRLRNLENFRYTTALFLLLSRELRLMSVWHPSLLTGLLDALERHRDRLVHDIAAGSFSPPAACEAHEAAPIRASLRPDRRRADEVRAVLPYDYCALWPKLSAISAWGDGHSRGPAEELARRFPSVFLQPKGLLATEGVVTIPFRGLHPLAIRSHFFEFIDTDGGIRLAHELQQGGEYSVVLTTGGGLYRYRLADRVRVDGVVGATPSLRFIGKEDRISDWFGEKLTDGFVAGVLQSLFAEGNAPRFALLAPERYPSGMAYTLYVEKTPDLKVGPTGGGARAGALDARLEDALRRNPHYAWCVDLGQLRPARIVPVGPGASQAYIEACAARGQRLGDVKPAALRPDTGWADVLPPESTAQELIQC